MKNGYKHVTGMPLSRQLPLLLGAVSLRMVSNNLLPAMVYLKAISRELNQYNIRDQLLSTQDCVVAFPLCLARFPQSILFSVTFVSFYGLLYLLSLWYFFVLTFVFFGSSTNFYDISFCHFPPLNHLFPSEFFSREITLCVVSVRIWKTVQIEPSKTVSLWSNF